MTNLNSITAYSQQKAQLRQQARQALRQVKHLRDDVGKLEKKIQRLSSPAPLHQPITELGRAMQPQAESQADKAERLDKLRRELNGKTYDLQHIEQAFEDMSTHPQYVEMLRAYYDRGDSAIVMADRMGYSERQFYRLLGQALELFAYHYMQ